MARSLKRFLVSTSLKNQTVSDKIQTILLTPEETHHLKGVLRLKEGNLCLLFDREGNEFLSRIEHFRAGASEVRLLEPHVCEAAKKLELTVAQALPQDRKMDEIVKKAAELGIFELIPLVTERTMLRISKERFGKVRLRWERIAAQTLKQSQVKTLPQISGPISFKELCADVSSYDQSFLFHPSDVSRPIKEIDSISAPDKINRLLMVIGPEGGFSDREVKEAQASGMKLITMGDGILKTDTAFVAGASFILFHHG